MIFEFVSRFRRSSLGLNNNVVQASFLQVNVAFGIRWARNGGPHAISSAIHRSCTFYGTLFTHFKLQSVWNL